MILIIGGAFQGKADFARRLTGLSPSSFLDGGSCSVSDLLQARAVRDFHLLIRRELEQGQDVSNLADRILEENPDLIIVTTELGYGVVPLDPKDRLWREQTGRVCTRLAQGAREVYRVICGIGQRLK